MMLSFQKRSRRCRSLFIWVNSSVPMPPTLSIEVMTLVELGDGFGDVLAGLRQADANRAAVDAGALMVDKAEVVQLLAVEVHPAGQDTHAGQHLGAVDRIGRKYAGVEPVQLGGLKYQVWATRASTSTSRPSAIPPSHFAARFIRGSPGLFFS